MSRSSCFHVVNTKLEIMVSRKYTFIQHFLPDIIMTGRFLLGILRDLLSWYSDQATFNVENKTKVGGKTTALPGLQQSFKMSQSPTNVLGWDEFRRILRKWHKRLTMVSKIISLH